MAGEKQATYVTMSVDTDLVNPDYRTIVCEETSEAGGDASTTDTPTKCGTFTSVANGVWTATGSGVVNVDPAADEVSSQELMEWLNNKTKLSAIFQDSSDGVSVAGAAVYIEGQGTFTSVRVTAQEGDLIKFNWAFSWSGTVITTPPASS